MTTKEKRQAKKAQRKAKRAPKTGAGKAKVKSGVNALITEVGKAMKRGSEPSMFDDGTSFSATTSKDIVVKAKKTKPAFPGGGSMPKFLLPGLAVAALAFFALKK